MEDRSATAGQVPAGSLALRVFGPVGSPQWVAAVACVQKGGGQVCIPCCGPQLALQCVQLLAGLAVWRVQAAASLVCTLVFRS
jgi:hypothetical protein